MFILNNTNTRSIDLVYKILLLSEPAIQNYTGALYLRNIVSSAAICVTAHENITKCSEKL